MVADMILCGAGSATIKSVKVMLALTKDFEVHMRYFRKL